MENNNNEYQYNGYQAGMSCGRCSEMDTYFYCISHSPLELADRVWKLRDLVGIKEIQLGEERTLAFVGCCKFAKEQGTFRY